MNYQSNTRLQHVQGLVHLSGEEVGTVEYLFRPILVGGIFDQDGDPLTAFEVGFLVREGMHHEHCETSGLAVGSFSETIDADKVTKKTWVRLALIILRDLAKLVLEELEVAVLEELCSVFW